MVDQGQAIIVVGIHHPDLPNLGFVPKRYSNSVRHLGFGFFEGATENGKFEFRGGGAMQHHDFAKGDYVSWTPLDASEEVLADLGYDFEKVKKALKSMVNLD